MFRIIWPTARPKMMKDTWGQWIANAKEPSKITIKIAVDTQAERDELTEFKDVLVVGEKRGPCFAVYQLALAVKGEPSDVVVLATDDMYPGLHWDTWISKHLNGHDGALLVNDSVQFGKCMTIPILTYSCLLKINRLLNHPSYQYIYADTELYHNLAKLGLIKNLRHIKEVMFEHRHYSKRKRARDEHDKLGHTKWSQDKETYKRRLEMPLEERLDPNIP